MRTLFLFLISAVIYILPTTGGNAATAISSQEMQQYLTEKMATDQNVAAEKEISLSKKMAKKVAKLQRKLEKFQKRIAKMTSIDIDLQDPVDKWMWYWILGWALGLALSIVFAITSVTPILWLSSLAWLAGTIFLIVWLVKKFGGA